MKDTEKGFLKASLMKTRNSQNSNEHPVPVRCPHFNKEMYDCILNTGQETVREAEENFKAFSYEENEKILKEACDKAKRIVAEAQAKPMKIWE